MQVNKLRIASDGPVPVGRYFAQIAENLRARNMHAAARATRADAQARRASHHTGMTVHGKMSSSVVSRSRRGARREISYGQD